jgi:cyclopropane fatty-acyl-phospholipid synthase-like methyltransferase
VLRAMSKPCAESCEQNRAPILEVLRLYLPGRNRLLEIGSGTGQHAAYFAPEFPELIWQTSDLKDNLPGIRAWLQETAGSNLPDPLPLDVTQNADWPETLFDAAFSANTAHIMSDGQVAAMFAGVGRVLADGGCFLLYGPFNYDGRYTSESNESFDGWLKARDPASGIKDRNDLMAIAAAAGLELQADIEMPVNNRILVWVRPPGQN